jgi:hypothetical protein
MEKKKQHYKLGMTFCKNCGVEFEKPLTEIRRNEKLNRPNFCSRSCVGKNNLKNFGEKRVDLSKLGYKRLGDEYTIYRYHFRNIKKRNQIIDVSIDDLKEQWELQNGICEFSGVKLILSSHTKIEKNPIYAASLDRIDNSKGYVKGNIRWVSRAMNWMKNTMTDDMVNELINIIIKNKKGS